MTCPRSCNSYSQSWFQKPGPWHQGHFSFCPISLPLLDLSLLWVLEQRACWSQGQCSLNLRRNWCSLWWAQLSFDFSEGNCANPKQLTPVCVPSADCRASCGSSHVYWVKRWGNAGMRKRRRKEVCPPQEQSHSDSFWDSEIGAVQAGRNCWWA